MSSGRSGASKSSETITEPRSIPSGRTGCDFSCVNFRVISFFSNVAGLRAEQSNSAVSSGSVTRVQNGVSGGADGVRTRDLIDAIDARSQLRYGPTVARRNSLITSGHAPVKRAGITDCQIAPTILNLSDLRV